MPLRNQRVNSARCGWNSVFHHFIDSVQMVLGRKRSWQKICGTTLMGVVDWVDRGLFFAASRLRQGWFPFAWELVLTKIYWAMDRRHLSFGAVLTDSRYFSICISHMDCIMSRYMHLRQQNVSQMTAFVDVRWWAFWHLFRTGFLGPSGWGCPVKPLASRINHLLFNTKLPAISYSYSSGIYVM